MKHKLDFKFYFSSIGLEESYQGIAISVEKIQFRYDEQDIENCILVKYCIPEVTWDALLTQEEITQIIISEFDLLVEILSLLLINPFRLLASKIFVDDVEFKPKFPIQSLGGLYNLLVERNKFVGSMNLTTLVHKNGWIVLENLVAEFRTSPQMNKSKVRLALRWCAKASNEYASIDRLVSYWISFNSLFEGLDDREQKAIEKYIDKNVDDLIAQRFYNNYQKQLSVLSSLKIELRNKRKVSDDLNTLLSANIKDFVSIIKMMILVVYGIRNNLFHGSYDPGSAKTGKNIVVSERLLSEFMKEIVSKEMLGYPLKQSVFRVQTKVSM